MTPSYKQCNRCSPYAIAHLSSELKSLRWLAADTEQILGFIGIHTLMWVFTGVAAVQDF